MRKEIEIANKIKKIINEKYPEIIVEIWNDKNEIVLLLSHERWNSNYYYLDKILDDTEDLIVISDRIISDYLKYQEELCVRYISENLMDIDNILNKIYCKVEFTPNEIDEDLVFIKEMNYLIKFYLKFKDPNGRIVNMPIIKSFLEQAEINIDVNVLFDKSIENIRNEYPFKIEKMQDTKNTLQINRTKERDGFNIVLFPNILKDACKMLNTRIITVYIMDNSRIFIFKGNDNLEHLKKIIDKNDYVFGYSI